MGTFVFNIISSIMKTKKKSFYETPESVVLEVQSEGIVCASPGDYSGFGKEQDW